MDNADPVDMYRALAELIRRSMASSAARRQVLGDRLGQSGVPFVVGIGGSVAAGKSTTARLLANLISALPSRPLVAVVSTDGFLLPNAELRRRGLLGRKGLPGTYDERRMLSCISKIATGSRRVAIPTYSHGLRDITPGHQATIRRPDVLIVEGLHVLDRCSPNERPTIFEHIDFGVYLDAALPELRHWYLARSAWFGREGPTAERLWRQINEVNLIEYIEPTRNAATVILVKNADHGVRRILVRRGLPGLAEFARHAIPTKVSS